jgi:hypothetical protein
MTEHRGAHITAEPDTDERHQDVRATLTVWSGSYPFVREDPFFGRAAWVGQRFVDAKARGTAISERSFRSEIVALTEMAPVDGQVLLADLKHRWAKPQAPPTLYALTCELRADASCVFTAGGESLGRKVTCTKVGRATRSLAGRLAEYAGRQILGGVPITPGSLVLRAVIYGHGGSMLTERDLKRVAAANGLPLQRIDKTGGRLPGSSEAYVGSAIVEAICGFGRERASARPRGVAG